jgi:hypothetical protein
MSGGKGGSNTSSVQIPSWLEGPAKENLAKAKMASEVGYMPYYGPDVAAQNANQLLGNQATYDAAAAFGLVPQGGDANAGVPTAQQFAGGITGYSSGDLYDQAVAELAERRPGQYAMNQSMFVDPQTGVTPVTFGGGTPEINQDYVSVPNRPGGNYEAPSESNPYMRSTVNDFGYVDPMSPKGLLANIFPGGGAMLMANNAQAVGAMQDLAGVDNPGFFGNLGTNARDSIGTSNINDYNYTVNLGGGLSDDGKTGLTPAEAATRMAFAQYDWADKIKAIQAEEAAAQAAAAARAQSASRSYSTPDYYNPSSGGNYDYSSGSGSLMGSLGSQVGVGSVNDASSNSGYAG